MPQMSTHLPPLLIDRLWRVFSEGLTARLEEFLRRLDDELMAASSNAIDFARANRSLMLAQVMRRSGEQLRSELLRQLEQDFRRFADGFDPDTADPLELSVATEEDTERTLALIKVSKSAKAVMPNEIDALERLLNAHRLSTSPETAPWHPRWIAETFHAQLEPLPIDVEDRLMLVHQLDRNVLRELQPELARVLETFQDAGYVVPDAPSKTGPTASGRATNRAVDQGPVQHSTTRPGEPTSPNTAWYSGWAASVHGSPTTAPAGPQDTPPTRQSYASGWAAWTPGPQTLPAQVVQEAPFVVLSRIEQAPEPTRFEPFVFDLLTGLFEQMFEQARLHPLLRAELARMQLPIARIAVRDTAFFRDRRHAARRLAAELLQTALRIAPDWTAERCQSSALWSLIHSTIDALIDDAPESSAACSALLDQLLQRRDAIDAETAQTIESEANGTEQRLEAIERALLDVQQRVADPATPLDQDARVQLYLAWSELIEAETVGATPRAPSNDDTAADTTAADTSVSAALQLLDAYLGGLRERRPLASFAPILARLRQHLESRVSDDHLRARIRQRLASAHLSAQRPSPSSAAGLAQTSDPSPTTEPEHATPQTASVSTVSAPSPAASLTAALPAPPESGAGDSAPTPVAPAPIQTLDQAAMPASSGRDHTPSDGVQSDDGQRDDGQNQNLLTDKTLGSSPSGANPLGDGALASSSLHGDRTADGSVRRAPDAEAFLERARHLHQRHTRRLRETFSERANDDDPSLLRDVFDDAFDQARQLAPGVWIEFRSMSGHRCERMKLVWMGVQTGRYVFASADGAAKRTHSAQGLAQEFRCMRARIVPEESLFDHVLDNSFAGPDNNLND